MFPLVNNLPSDLPLACQGQMSGADSGTTLYCFDEFERMVTARGPGLDKETAVYDYDGLDRRDSKIERTSSGADKRRDYGYVGLSRRLSREQNADGKTLYYDYSANGEREGQAKAPSGQTDPTSYRSYGKDANGSVEELEEHDGSTPENSRYVYDPYGERDLADGQEGDEGLSEAARDNPFRFESFYYDSGVKTYDMQARQVPAHHGPVPDPGSLRAGVGGHEPPGRPADPEPLRVRRRQSDEQHRVRRSLRLDGRSRQSSHPNGRRDGGGPAAWKGRWWAASGQWTRRQRLRG